MIITLTTDFGLSDPFVGVMKGVILAIAPNARLVDITHDIPSHDIGEAAFILHSSYRYFPEGAIHVAVVDPGVGGARRPVAASMHNHVFVGPDNGILSLDSHSETYHITNASLFHHPVSQTFHGRDIFAPVAAHLARGAPIDSVGPRIDDFIRTSPFKSRPSVIRVDKFGNVVTNIRRESLRPDFAIRIGGVEIRRMLSNYDDAQPGELFAIEGSTGFVEVSLKRGSAAETLHIGPGAEIEVETFASNQ